MDNSLIVKTPAISAIAKKENFENLLKPLSQEIHLFDTFIAGTSEIKNNPIKFAKKGDKLTLQRKVSKFDDNEIAIFNEQGQQLGYVPEKDNVIFARLMDAGKKLIAYILDKEKKFGLDQVSIAIFLVDF